MPDRSSTTHDHAHHAHHAHEAEGTHVMPDGTVMRGGHHDHAAHGQTREWAYSSVHACTFQNGPVFVGLPVKPLSRAGTASSLVTP